MVNLSSMETDTNVSQQKYYNVIPQCISIVRTTTHVNGEPAGTLTLTRNVETA